MSDIETDEMEFSLADLAGLDVSDIEEIRFEQLPQIAGEFKVVEGKLEEYEKDDNGVKQRRFKALFICEVMDVKAVLEAGVDKESLVGKKHTETLYMNPGAGKEKMAEAIGRIRAFVADMGAPNGGPLGQMIENTAGTIFKGKTVKQKNDQDPSNPFIKLRPEPAKK